MATKLDRTKLKAELELYVNQEYRNFLLDEIPKGEGLLAQITQEHENYWDIARPLSKMYIEMNRQLGITCRHLHYPTQQWTWNDSLPLEELGRIYQGIEITQWYQRHLTMIVMPAEEHVWTKIIAWPEKKPSDSRKVLANR